MTCLRQRCYHLKAMIPPTITRDHLLAALADIDRSGIPTGRRSTGYLLLHNGKYYPPKYVVSLAAKIATGFELRSGEFGGGSETNRFLTTRGFTTLRLAPSSAPTKPQVVKSLPPPIGMSPLAIKSPPAPATPTAGSHSERCRECKATVLALLKSLYGDVHVNVGFEVGTQPADFKGLPYHPTLSKIYEMLRHRRGFGEFVRTSRLPNCDFFVSQPGFVVEFDESQHFTAARADALQLYPEHLGLGFKRLDWISRCREIAAEDNDPAFRDEQRAWYDTLRDFLPSVKGLRSTIRLYAKQYVWCSLNPSQPRDRDTFRQILGARADFWSIHIRSCPDPVLARVIIDGLWDGDVVLAKALLREISKRYAGSPKVKCLSTCGAFLTFDFPKDFAAMRDNLNPPLDVINQLIARADEVCSQLLDESTIKQLRSVSDYLTLGVDSRKRLVSTTHNRITEPHVELVCLVDLRTNARHWTGKFYPTSNQAGTIIRFTDLKSHFVDLDCGKAMVLGCHDMTVFNPRSQTNAGGWRQQVSEEFRALTKIQEPTFVLHHPHTAVKSRTWLQAWSGLHQEVPSVRFSLGTGAYSMADEGWDGRNTLDEVLASTKRGPVTDVIICVAGPA